MFRTMVRGGQITAHNWKMGRQVLKITILVTLMAGVSVFGVKSWYDYSPYQRSAALAYYWADFKTEFPLVGQKHKRGMTQFYTMENGKQHIVRSLDIVNDPWHRTLVEHINTRLIDNALFSLWVILGFFFVISGVWFWYGQKQQNPIVLSGLSIIHWRALKRKLKKPSWLGGFGKADIFLGKLPFPRVFENEHLYMVGTTGSGKSNAINQILKATRPIGKKTIVVDTTGGYVARFYNPETDKLLNPFDERSQTWNIFDECIEDYDFMEFAESLIPPSKRDEFWVKAAQQLLATAADKLKEEGKMTIGALLDILLTKPLDEAAEDFKGTNVVTYFDPESGKMAHGIRATLIGALWSLKYIEEAETYFSIRKWVQDPSETGWLFICCNPTQRNVLRPLMTGWLSIAIKSLMAMPEDITRRVWFIMDEIASLNYVPCLVGAMQEVRKYGGSFLLGMQNFGQIHKIYGHDDCNTLFDLAGTKIGLSSTGDSATQLSKSFGQQEVIESIENLSYGAHEYRDSTSLSRQRQVRATVSATDLMMLNPFEAYIKFPRNLPITKIKFSLQKLPLQAEIYVKKSKEIFPKTQESKLISLSNAIYKEKESDDESDLKKVALEKESLNGGIRMDMD